MSFWPKWPFLVDERHHQVEVAVDVLHAYEPLGGIHLDLVEGDGRDVVRWVAVLPLDLDIAHRVGVGLGRSDPLHFVDAVLEEPVVAADRCAELPRIPGDFLDLRDKKLGFVAIHPLTLLRVVGEMPLTHLHKMPETVDCLFLTLGVRAPELVEVSLHELAVARNAGVDTDVFSGLDAEQPRTIPPLVAAHIGCEAFALLAPIVVVLVVVVVAMRKSADRDEVGDCRSRRRLHPVIEHLASEVAAVACVVHPEDARIRSDIGQPKVHGTASVAVLGVVGRPVLVFGIAASLLEVPLPRASGVVLDVLAPALAQTRLPERFLRDLLGGDGVPAELVRPPIPRCDDVHDLNAAVVTALELQELFLQDAAAAVVALLVVELVAVCREDAIERGHRADPVRHDGDRVTGLREADILRRHGREVGLPRVLAGLDREPRLENVGERCDAAVLASEGHGLLEGRHKAVRVVEGHRTRLRFLSCHRDTPFPFLGFWGCVSSKPPW